MTEDRLLTVPEVAARLRASEITVRKWLRAGRLQGKRFGGTKLGWSIPESEVQRFITAAGPSQTNGTR